MASINVRLLFPSDQAGKPVSYHLVKDFDLVFNIFQAQIKPGMRGEMIIDIEGTDENIQAGIDFLRKENIKVEPLDNCITWNEDECVHCGACTSVCPSGALTLNEDAMLVFDHSKCVACELCIKACPSSVMKLNFS